MVDGFRRGVPRMKPRPYLIRDALALFLVAALAYPALVVVLSIAD
jgi:hypothetical protein